MDHYIVYHNADLMERSFRDDPHPPSTEFSIVTKKLGHSLRGNAIWLISGEGKPRDYRLEYWFIVDDVQRQDEARFPTVVSGAEGVVLDNGIELTHLAWFKKLKSWAGNFGLGLMHIPEEYASELCKLAAAAGWRVPEAPRASRAVADPDDNEEFSAFEGRVAYTTHRRRERDRELVARAKQARLSKTGQLKCDVCEFDFSAVYGPLGHGFIEAHHTIPLSKLAEETRQTLRDLAMVCANCHRMLHRGERWPSVAELRALVRKAD